MTSIERGTAPLGKSLLLSYILIFYQSTKTEPSSLKLKLFWLVHDLLVQNLGVVNLNYYSFKP